MNDRERAGPLAGASRGSAAEPFGVLPNGDSVHVFTLHNGDVSMRVTDYGGIVLSIETPDRTGTRGDLVLGFAQLDGYIERSPYFRSLIGRYANRLAKGRFPPGATCPLNPSGSAN